MSLRWLLWGVPSGDVSRGQTTILLNSDKNQEESPGLPCTGATLDEYRTLEATPCVLASPPCACIRPPSTGDLIKTGTPIGVNNRLDFLEWGAKAHSILGTLRGRRSDSRNDLRTAIFANILYTFNSVRRISPEVPRNPASIAPGCYYPVIVKSTTEGFLGFEASRSAHRGNVEKV